jgi:hypothetical protein
VQASRPDVPNFFMVGAPKCGTTAWVTYLRDHPGVSFGKEKEPHYFGRDLRWKRQTTLEHYRTIYAGLDEVPVVGDASVLSLYSERAAERIAEHNPGSRVLIMLRDHVSFLRSYHNEMLFHGVETVEDLETAWRLSDQRRAGRGLPATCPDARLLDYPAVARFLPQVKRFYDHFPPEQVRVMWLNDWRTDPRSSYVSLLEWLGLPDDGRTDFPIVGAAKSHKVAALKPLLTHGPPQMLVKVFRAVKRALGFRQRTYLMKKLKLANTHESAAKSVSDAFAAELTAFYEGDREAVDALRASNRAS